MVTVIGDSHANSFKGWGVKVIYLGAVTLKRMSWPDYLIEKAVRKAWGKRYFIFGEIDIRCHYGDRVKEMIERYCKRLERLKASGLIAVPPPAPRERAEGSYPVVNSDEHRVTLTNEFNKQLKEEAVKRSWKFVDLSHYAENGFLKEELSDGNVHIKDKRLRKLL